VLTAAHCAADLDPDQIEVVAGEENLVTGTAKPVAVDDAIIYPGYVGSEFGSGDVAILRLHKSITGITPATIAPSLPAAGSDVQIAGWGRTNPEGAFPGQMQQATVQVVADATCRDDYQTGFLSDSMFCAGVVGGGVDSCSGDSGGPLMVASSGTFEVAGVVSSGLGCALAQFPGLYARVTAPALRNWVLSDPPVPPEEDFPPTITGSGLVGKPLACHRGSWISTVSVSYAYQWIRLLDGQAVGTGSHYTPKDADRGVDLLCVVTVKDAAGNVSSDAAFANPILKSSSEAPDRTRPKATRPSLSCAGSACTVKVHAVDHGGSGLLRVELSISTVSPTGTVSMLERDLHVHHGVARASLTLPPGSHVVFARAVDRAGNRQKTPARLDVGGGTRTTQVIGGTPTTTGTYPFMGAIVFRGVSADQGLYCGGTLIAPTVVMTAAHCVAFSIPVLYDVVFGRSTLSASDGERIPVVGISWDPKYSPDRLGNDVALLHLDHAPTGITPAPLLSAPKAALAAAGQPAKIVGWGATYSDDNGEIYPDQLRDGDVVMQSDAICDRDVGGIFEPATMTCAAAGATGQTTCHGDSGGPLLVDDSGTLTVAGITSFGLRCGSTTTPSVFTRVLGVRSWLDSDPPAAPIQWGGVFVSGNVRVGGTASCVVRVSGDALTERVQWLDGSKVAHTGPTWRLTPAVAGHAIACRATVSNNGGSIQTDESATRRVLATGHGDNRAPSLSSLRITCTSVLGSAAPTCVARVSASDRGSGVAAVSLLIDAQATGGGHVTRAFDTTSSRATSTLPKIAHGTYRILATAVDRSGNRSAPEFVTRTF
jgi:secreted trypsin-like serine protease